MPGPADAQAGPRAQAGALAAGARNGAAARPYGGSVRGARVHLPSSVRVAVLLALLYVLLSAVVLLVAGAVSAQVGRGPVGAVVAVLAVVSWAAAGWLGTRQHRADGAPRLGSAASAGVGGVLGYGAVPGLLATVGLLLSGAGAAQLATGPLLSTLLAGAVAALAAGLSPHAPPPAPYVA